MTEPINYHHNPVYNPGDPEPPEERDDEQDPEGDYCLACGATMGRECCEYCEDGMNGHDCGEDCCCCLQPEENVPCQICDGQGFITWCPECRLRAKEENP